MENARQLKIDDTAPSPLERCRATLSEWVRPTHTNAHGTAFGGTVAGWIDVVGLMAAQRYARAQVVTLSIDCLQFLAPIKIGDTVLLTAEICYVGKTSLEVEVRVEAENAVTGQTKRVATAYVSYVAVDADGHPIQVPPHQPRNERERVRFEDSEERRAQRRKWRE